MKDEKIWKEVVVTYFKVPCQYLLGRIRITKESIIQNGRSLCQDSIPNLQNTKHEWWILHRDTVA